MLVAPIAAAAKPEAVDDLLSSFSAMYSERVIEERPTDLARYGLAQPSAVARATLSDGTTLELRLGDQTPAGTTWYLMAAGDPRVFAVWMNHGQHLGYGVNDLFLARKVLTINTERLTRLRVLRDGAPMIEVKPTPELVRSDAELRSSYLSVTYPYARPKPLDSFGLTERFLTPLGRISMETVVDPAPRDLSRYGLDRPSFEIAGEDGQASMDILVGKIDGERVYVGIPGEKPVYAAPRALADLVSSQKPFEWVSRFAAIVRGSRNHLLGERHAHPGDRPRGLRRGADGDLPYRRLCGGCENLQKLLPEDGQHRGRLPYGRGRGGPEPRARHHVRPCRRRREGVPRELRALQPRLLRRGEEWLERPARQPRPGERLRGGCGGAGQEYWSDSYSLIAPTSTPLMMYFWKKG